MTYLSMSYVCIFSMSSTRVLLLLHQQGISPQPLVALASKKRQRIPFVDIGSSFQIIEEWNIENPTFVLVFWFYCLNCQELVFFFFKFYFIFKLYNIVLVLPNIEMNPPQVYMCSPSWTLLPPHTIPLGRPSAPAPSIQYPASNLDWQLVSYMILYMFQCHSPKSSHPLPLPQSPKDCSIHLFDYAHIAS